jgi:hypothetical protein
MKPISAYRQARRVALLIMSLPLIGQTMAETWEPAAFGDTLAHIQQTVTRPELTDDFPVVSVYCQADVSISGTTSNVRCHEKEGFDQLLEQTTTALSGRTFTPARANGVEVPVRMHLRVVYAKLDGQPPILLLPNLGNMQSHFGHSYTAPQERLDQPQWYETYRANDWSEGQLFFSNDPGMTRVLAMVSAEGETLIVRRIEAHGHHKRDAVEVEKALKDSRFIPGFANGKPERMQYVAVLHYPSGE